MAWRFLPPWLDLESVSISFDLPARTVLKRTGIAALATSSATALRLTLAPTLLRVAFEPYLVIDLPPPLGDMGLQQVEYDLRTGAMTPNVFYTGGLVRVGKDSAEDEARAFMRGLVTSTPMAIPPYDPTSDPDLVVTVRQVLLNLESDGGGPAVRGARVSARLTLREALAGAVGSDGFRIPAGATIAASVDVEGTRQEIETAPRVQRIEVDCSSAVLLKRGVEQADLRRFVVSRGGEIAVERVEPLGAAGQAAGVESLVRLFSALAAGGGVTLDPKHLGPSAVEGLVKEEIARALRPALVDWVRQNAEIIVGMDLRQVLGIPEDGGVA
ncbi:MULTISPECIES: hypothetical protein [Sorangium]|uniref:Uncharacterized protein n=1 Tax=Sorangium cellulosum TaxID=56 RepID=A0A4P2QF45_SORCE|nr:MULTISPECIES: hypothetical protein [Sorangium]AUX28048.1 hypothetical protein SOCE836_001160 [Sorangium cellulosum]WCQ87453.1 hypothetical protein NQZ70_00116 [Sorangium sp. Soce836]